MRHPMTRWPRFLSPLILVALMTSCQQEVDQSQLDGSVNPPVPQKTRILLADDRLKESRALVPGSIVLSEADIPRLDSLVREGAQAAVGDLALDDYYRHFTPLDDWTGRQFILVYGSCRHLEDDWFSLFEVRDGGRCFWQAWIDVKKDRVVRFFFHGEA